MKSMLLLLALIASGSANAAVNRYDLNMELSVQGRPAIKPRLIVSEGEKAFMNQKSKADSDETFVEVLATEAQKNGIMMRFKIGFIKNGSRQVIAEPTIVALAGEPAKIEIANDQENSKSEISLSVVANRTK